jgi:hypothetical protein
MRSYLKGLTVATVATLFTGCATLFSSGPNTLALQSDTAGADVYINGNLRGKTPLTLELDNTKPVTVTFKQAGRQDQTVEVGTKVRGGMIVLDVLGGLVPVIIDAATGEWKKLDTKLVNMNLLPRT